MVVNGIRDVLMGEVGGIVVVNGLLGIGKIMLFWDIVVGCVLDCVVVMIVFDDLCIVFEVLG